MTAPKVRGTLNLDAATRHLDLEFFALFSSVAGVYGSPGQSDYSAANAFLDAFARHRRTLVDAGERSGRTVAISWPLWADGGMTLDEVTRDSLRRERGWEDLPTEDGLRAFGRALLVDAPAHLVVAYGAKATLAAQRRAAPAPRPRPPPRPPPLLRQAARARATCCSAPRNCSGGSSPRSCGTTRSTSSRPPTSSSTASTR